MKLEWTRLIFEKSSNIKLHENPFIGNRVVPNGQTDMMKLIVAFFNFVSAPKAVSTHEGKITRDKSPYLL